MIIVIYNTNVYVRMLCNRFNTPKPKMQMCEVRRKLTFLKCATNKWITNITHWTTTDRIVIDSLTTSLIATNRRCTWIDTPVIYTGFIEHTFRIDGTFWSTTRRTSDRIFKTRAYSSIINFFTLTVWSAWWWMTQMNFGFWNYADATNNKQH